MAAARARADATALERLEARLREVRATTAALASDLTAEDQQVQSMPDVSPTKWHLAHTTWFFETFVLGPHVPGYRVFDERWGYLFNSYYEGVGERHPRPRRGLLTRPPLSEVQRYREHVEAALESALPRLPREARDLVTLGCHHEQQHQELLLMDIKHVFSINPLLPAYAPAPEPEGRTEAAESTWCELPGGVYEVGHDGRGFAFDNEGPRHRVLLEGARLGSRLVTNGEFLAFVEDGGYARPDLWLSDGIAAVRAEGWEAPLYWRRVDGAWFEFTLSGLRPLDLAAPVVHVSYYEADAFATWAGARLPREEEWEALAAGSDPDAGNLLASGHLHPVAAPAAAGGGPTQLLGDCWEWTRSDYGPYPGYSPPSGAVGEYNGKFMCNQRVLRGGCCATPPGHLRTTYRNFYYPHQRWMFAGIRLAQDV